MGREKERERDNPTNCSDFDFIFSLLLGSNKVKNKSKMRPWQRLDKILNSRLIDSNENFWRENKSENQTWPKQF